MTLNAMTLEQYFHHINKQEKQDMSTWKQEDEQEPLTHVIFQITTPAVEQYPAHSHTLDIKWEDGGRWYEVLWEIMSVLEASYGYNIKDKVFFKMHDVNIQAEEWHGDPDLAKQMFSKDLS